MLQTLITLALLAPASAVFPTAVQAPEEPTLEMRLERLVERLEETRVSEHIPGMALAVVQGDEVVLTHGFGLANMEDETPVTPETLFGIGSTTKAFTTALMAMLIDEDALDWDDPITEYLPYFELDTGKAGEEVTLRDLMCHRTGFTRMSLLCVNPEVSRKTILETAAQAEPWAPFRKEFHYSNVMFLAAGVAAGQATDSSWDELIDERIFQPLGMEASDTRYAEAKDRPTLASGYHWNADLAEHESRSLANIDTIGPAGSITSNVIDMAQWLRLQLGDGEIDGTRLISEDSLEATRTAQIQIAGNVSYGLGWMVRDWHGEPLIEHGGNTEGFAAEVAFLPESQVGYVLLTNTSVTALQSGSLNIVFDTLLGEWETPGAEGDTGAEGVDYDDYVGNYIANFSSFKDADFEVQVKDGKLAVDVPGQTLYALKAPDSDGRWVFELTDQIAVSFDRDDAGEVVGMKMYQGGFAFEIPREGVVVAPVIALEELQQYLGEYDAGDGTAAGSVIIQNNRLAVDIPGEMVFELHPPDDAEHWAFRIRKEISISFQQSGDGSIESLTLHRPNSETTLAHISDGPDISEDLPTLADVMSLRNAPAQLAAFESAGTLRLRGTARFANAGIEGSYEMLAADAGRYSEMMDFDPFGVVGTTIDGERGWSENPMQGVQPVTGKQLGQALLAHPKVTYGDWSTIYETASVLGIDEQDGREVFRVRLKHGDLPSKTLYIDSETGDVLRTDDTAISDLVNIPVTIRFEDHREVDGLRLPFRTVVENDWSGRLIIQLEEVETGVEIDPTRFEREEAGDR